jgi:biotin carboxyl carrier protein
MRGKVTSPIAGSVVEIKGQVGQVVHEGDVILVIEAMKMNTSIAAPGNGKITAIPVAVGDSVREGQVLAELEA